MSEIKVLNSYGTPFFPRKDGDVGYDLYAMIERDDQTWFEKLLSLFYGLPLFILWPVVGTRLLPSGIALHMDDDLWCEIRARSSTSRKKLQILGGTIDSGYRGDLYTFVHNFGFRPRIILHGERYAQAVFYPAVRPTTIPVSAEVFAAVVHLEEQSGGRGASGFGSTGD